MLNYNNRRVTSIALSLPDETLEELNARREGARLEQEGRQARNTRYCFYGLLFLLLVIGVIALIIGLKVKGENRVLDSRPPAYYPTEKPEKTIQKKM